MRNDFTRRLDHAKCNTSLAELQKQFPEVTKGRFKLRDGGGLFLQVEPSGSRGWRFSYNRPITGKPNTLSFGPFPEISLSEARDKCDAARKLVAHGQDPSEHKQEVKRAAVMQSADAVTFRGFTNFEIKNAAGEVEVGAWWQFAMIDEKSRVSGEAKSFETVRRVQIDLRTLQETLGDRPMKEIKSGEILAILDRLSKKGNLNKAHRVQQMATRIFNLAVARQVCDYNVAAPCKDAIATHIKKKMPAVTDAIEDIGLAAAEAKVGELLRRIRDYDGRMMTRKALEMMMLTFPRPANITTMEWKDIEGDLWTIPEQKMKMHRLHKVALSRQALAILEQMKALTGNGPRVFPVTKNTLTRALGKMGYDTETEQSTHGVRSIASTLLNESGVWSSDAIEIQMAHKIGGKRDGARSSRVRGDYNKAARLDERKAMLQYWADYLDGLRDGNVVAIKQAA